MRIQTDGLIPEIPESLDEDVSTLAEVGIAVDVGTTTVAVNVWSLATRRLLATVAEKNSQMRYGFDVIKRITFATRPPLTGSSQVVESGPSALHYAIVAQLEKMFSQAMVQASTKADRGIRLEVSKIVITGNTTMLSFVCAFPVDSLAVAPFTPPSHFGFVSSWHEVRTGQVNEKCSHLDLPTPEILHLFSSSVINKNTSVYFPPCIGAFIGADTVCAMLSAGFSALNGEKHTAFEYPLDVPLLITDIGTNTEIALYIPSTDSKKSKILCTSAAAGPAFEAANISCGMSSVDGAIDKVFYNGNLECSVIGGGCAKGICGSGLISAGAVLYKNNFIDSSGVIQKSISKLGDGTNCIQLTPAVYLSQSDIRNMQLAKSAVFTGLSYMIERSPSLPVLCLAGSFGSNLDMQEASAIGLIPSSLEKRCVSLGNAALAGASALLFSKTLRNKALALAKNSIQINLAAVPDFQQRYLSSIDFKSH
ncbi:ASKHA domain-containing protein [Treponema pectinovorum]|uniref:ASKHA domain-containing protein n=1 Tax=Treponema pectinovorum TaxID=164 RepID=UPI0011CC8B18|nr:ASKHA domain-containing protein [Treponema pectinovorum]